MWGGRAWSLKLWALAGASLLAGMHGQGAAGSQAGTCPCQCLRTPSSSLPALALSASNCWAQQPARRPHLAPLPLPADEAAPLHWLPLPAAWVAHHRLVAVEGLEVESKQELFPAHAHGNPYPSNAIVAATLSGADG